MEATRPVDHESLARAVESPTADQSTLRPLASHDSRTSRRRGPRLPFKIVDTYLFSQVVEATLRGLVMFVMLLLFFGVMTATRKLLDNQVSFLGAMQIIGYQLPRILLFTLPMSVLYGTLHAFADLSTRGEIIAMGAGGMSFGRMLRAPLLWAAMLTLLAFWLQERVVPRAEVAKDATMARFVMQSAKAQRDFKFTDELPDGSSRTVSAESFDPRAKTLTKPVITVFDKNRQFQAEISADRAQWNPTTGKWSFFQGQQKFWSDPKQAAQSGGTASIGADFSQTTFDAPNPMQMSTRAKTRIENLQKNNFEFVSMDDLREWRATIETKLNTANPDARERERLTKLLSGATYGFHDKIATPLICMALVLIAMPLGLRPQRSTGGFSMGLSLVILMMYYIVWTAATQAGKLGAVNPFGAAYFPLAMTILLGGVLMWKKTR